MRYLGGAALVAAVLISLTACGSQAPQPSATPSITVAPTTSAPAPTPTETVTVTATPYPTPTSTPASNRPANQCADDDLGVGVYPADGGGAAGSEYYNVLFTNTGGEPCALRGTPGVSVVGGSAGPQIGPAADRIQTGVKTLTMQPGDSLAAPLRIVNIGTDGGPLVGCTVKKGAGYLVYPPHSSKAFFVQDPDAAACASGPTFMTASPVIRFTD